MSKIFGNLLSTGINEIKKIKKKTHHQLSNLLLAALFPFVLLQMQGIVVGSTMNK